jgi:hypothetical protein
MEDKKVELLWCAFRLIEAVLLLFAFAAVALLCKWLLRRISWKDVKRRPAEYAMVHPLGTLRPPRSFDAAQSKAIDRSPGEGKKRVIPPNTARPA